MNSFSQRLLALLAVVAFLFGAPTGVTADPSQPGDCPAWHSDDSEVRETFWSYATPEHVLGCLDAGADLHARDSGFGATPLHWAAAFSQDPAVVTALLDAGANPALKASNGETPLEVAVNEGRPAEIIASLQVVTSLPAACEGWNNKSRGRRTWFFRKLTPDAALTCLEAGADPNARDNSGWTPLHHKLWSGNSTVLAALLDAGADPNARDDFGDSLLHGPAAFSDNPATLALLLDAGADPNARNLDGDTPLHRAAARTDNPAVVALLDASADPNARSHVGYTPLHFAAVVNENAAIVAALLDAGADPNLKNDNGQTPLDLVIGQDRPTEIIEVLEAAQR